MKGGSQIHHGAIAEFINRPDQNLWGTAEAFWRSGQQFGFPYSHAAA